MSAVLARFVPNEPIRATSDDQPTKEFVDQVGKLHDLVAFQMGIPASGLSKTPETPMPPFSIDP